MVIKTEGELLKTVRNMQKDGYYPLLFCNGEYIDISTELSNTIDYNSTEFISIQPAHIKRRIKQDILEYCDKVGIRPTNQQLKEAMSGRICDLNLQ